MKTIKEMEDTSLYLFVFINFVSLLIIFICSIIYLFSSTFSEAFLREIHENFMGVPIYTLNNNCNEPLQLGYWGGTTSGCDCLGIRDRYIRHSNSFIRGSCNYNETRAGCIDYKSKPKIIINKYKGFSFCINKGKEIVDYKQYLKNTVSKNEDCPFGFKSCGYLDTLEQKLCIKIDEECPINDLYINNVNDSPKDYFTFPLNDNKYLHYTNKNNLSYIVTRIKLSEDNEPCIYPGEFSWKYHHVLEQSSGYCKISIESEKYDKRYIEIDSINKYDLYYENGIIQSIGNLPLYDFNILRTERIYLYKRTFLGFDKKCMETNKFSYEYFDKLRDEQSRARSFVKYNFIILLIIVISIVLFLVFLSKGGDSEVLKILCMIGIIFIAMLKDSKDVGAGSFIILSIIHIILFIFNFIAFYSLLGNKINFNCGDVLTNGLIKELKRVIGSNMTTCIVMMVCSSIVIFIIFGILISKIYQKIYEYLIEKEWKSDLKNFLIGKKNNKNNDSRIYVDKDNIYCNDNCEKPKENIINIPTPGVNQENICNQNIGYTPFEGTNLSTNENNNNQHLNNNNLENNYPPPPNI